MKTIFLLLGLTICGFKSAGSEICIVTHKQLLNAEKGTAIGLGKTKSLANLRARRNIPKGARKVGATKYVKNADGSYTAYMDWRK